MDNSSHPASLELHKIYRVIADDDAARDVDIRVIVVLVLVTGAVMGAIDQRSMTDEERAGAEQKRETVAEQKRETEREAKREAKRVAKELKRGSEGEGTSGCRAEAGSEACG